MGPPCANSDHSEDLSQITLDEFPEGLIEFRRDPVRSKGLLGVYGVHDLGELRQTQLWFLALAPLFDLVQTVEEGFRQSPVRRLGVERPAVELLIHPPDVVAVRDGLAGGVAEGQDALLFRPCPVEKVFGTFLLLLQALEFIPESLPLLFSPIVWPGVPWSLTAPGSHRIL